VFFDSKVGKTLYSRDSLKRDYKEMVKRIQTIKFLDDYFKVEPAASLDIFYFNNKGINQFNVNNINKSPKEWEMHDNYLKSFTWAQKHNIRSSIDETKAIKISQQLNCGCNFRFDNSYIEKGILFEVSENKNASMWVLLPDDKVLLYMMEGKKVLNYDRSEFGEENGILYPCILFDLNGEKYVKNARGSN